MPPRDRGEEATVDPVLRARADALLDLVLAELLREARLRPVLGHLRYAQLAATPATKPADGLDRPYDRDRATDHGVTWRSERVDLPPTGPVQLSVDEYLAPEGPGWVLRAELEYQGARWIRVIHGDGPQPGRAHGWREVTDGP